MVFVAHDLSVPGFFSDDVAVVYLGCDMELGPAGARRPQREMVLRLKHVAQQFLCFTHHLDGGRVQMADKGMRRGPQDAG